VDSALQGAVFRLEAENALAELGGQLQLGEDLQYPPVGNAPEVVNLPVRFGRNITLLGVLPPQAQNYHPGDILAITTYWRIDGEPPSRPGVFTRLHDTLQSSPYTETNVLDVIPGDLQERDVIIQTNFMAIPDTLLPGDYILTLGAFDNNPLNQIQVFGNDVSVGRGDYLLLRSRLKIEPPENS
ncbi:MAG TPA: hypothetical protein VJZ27_12790, partial [Aggregatilineales bacterium]|nr:hypothetical protein [Aggregatilineales bacterium]